MRPNTTARGHSLGLVTCCNLLSTMDPVVEQTSRVHEFSSTSASPSTYRSPPHRAAEVCVCVCAMQPRWPPPSLPPLPSLKAQGSRLKASTRDSRRRGCQDPAVRRGRRGGWWARLHRDRLAREMASSLTAVTRGQAWWLHQTARRTLKWPLLWALARYAQHADARNAGH